ncbi:MAG: TonB-dependent receptor [candidate division KSB1 bacterium]|nr:TonB-dependent receptor [candidate division KSB1 bacterium]
MRDRFWSLCLWLATAPLLAQQPGEGVITGRVTDARTHKPIPFAEIIVIGHERGDASDARGVFLIRGLPGGEYDLQVRRQGYSPRTLAGVRITPDDTLRLDIALEPAVIAMDELVVTASRVEEFEYDIPQLISMVTQQHLRDRMANQTPEALREAMGVFMQKTNHGGGSPILRGLKANKVLLLIDGIRMNNATYRGGNLQYLNTVDPFSLQRIEVVHGPVSVLYGSDALGGAIHLVTRKPALSSNGLRWQAALRGLVSSADESRMAHGQVMVAGRRLGLLASGGWRSYGDVTRGSRGGEVLMQRLRNDSRADRRLERTQSPNGYQAHDLFVKALWQPAADAEIVLAYQNSRQPEVPRYDVYEVQKYLLWQYRPQERDLAYAVLRWKRPNCFFQQAALTMSWHRQYEQRVRQKRASSWRTYDAFRTVTLGAQLQFTRIVADNHLLIYGMDYYRDRVAARSFRESPDTEVVQTRAPLFPDGSRYSGLGLYAWFEWRPAPRFKLDFGGRYSAFRLTAPFSVSHPATEPFGTVQQSPSAVTFSLGMKVDVAANLAWVANLAQGFRAPNLDDVSKLGPGKGGRFYDVPNLQLRPEKNWSVDTGFKWLSEKLKGEAVVYYNVLRDMMVRRPAAFTGKSYVLEGGDTLWVYHKANAGRAFTTGFAAGFEWRPTDGWLGFGNLSYTYGQDLTHDEPLSGIPPLSSIFGVRHERGHFWWELNLRFAGAQQRLSAEDRQDLRIPEGGTPGWTTLNLRVGYELTPRLRLRASVMNLLDENYREHLSGFNAPGRNIIVQVDYQAGALSTEP